MKRGMLALLALCLFPGPSAAQVVRGGPLPSPLPLFPVDNWWNLDISSAPLDPSSSSFITFIGPTRGLHPDFGGDSSPSPEIYGMVYMTVPGTESLEPVAFDYVDESDPGAPGRPAGYPIPAEAKTQTKWIEGGYPGNAGAVGDKHMLIVDTDHRLLFETWNTRCEPMGLPNCTWRAGSGAVFPLDTNARRPDGWTSADAAGLAILPGLVRYDEVSGVDPIRHAFRFTVRATNGYVWPASHTAGGRAGALPMGARLRLKASKSIAGQPASVQRIFQAMKTYGLIVADNGSDMYVQGAYDTRWDNGVLNPAFASLTASDFEVVQLGWRGAAPTATSFYSVPPCRVVDTRGPNGPVGGPALAAGGTRTFAFGGSCLVPADASAVSVNVTVTAPAAAGYLTLFPSTTSVPVASTLNFRAGQTRANNAIVRLGSDGLGALSVLNGSAGTAELVLDVNGWFR